MIFDAPVPFAQALAKLQAAGKLPTNLTAAQVRALDNSIRRYAGAASQELLQNALDEVHNVILDLLNPQQVKREGVEHTVTEGLNPATARIAMQDILAKLGGEAEFYPADFALRIATENANGAGRYVAANDPETVELYPAWELTRMYDRDVPRGTKRGPKGELVAEPGQSWPSRWRAAADADWRRQGIGSLGGHRPHGGAEKLKSLGAIRRRRGRLH